MCFSMFRSKSKNSEIIKPRKSTQNFTPSDINSPSSRSRSQSKSRSNEFNSKSSSISSKNSLSSLKDSLPENPHIYDLSEIRSATKNFLLKPFSSSSSSTSWKCVINKKQSVVTQRKLRRPIDNSELRRKLSLLCKSHHASLVKLNGASVSGNCIYLVYEFISGASLNDCLRNPRNPNFTVLSNWISRVQIIAGIADGLDYMHNSAGFKSGFVHNHIKSSSIVVSEEPALVAKICHFGTAQLCGEVPEAIMEEDDETLDFQVLKRVGSAVGKFVGTRGYMSPEFQTTGIPTLKSDVFAFGVVLLEILSGEEPMKVHVDSDKGIFRKVSLIETAREVVGDGAGKLRQWIDRRLRDSYPVEVAEGLARVALGCVQEDPGRRPDMGQVAGWISKYYLESKIWAQGIGLPDGITASFAPR
ncbi:lysM domain receptor-like kinase 3 [Chenopodium quinoa]|uniref:lysM domain receptor-like kinase 3 n=1 Tax=Chenopodium quinoa TaxID=63459 RepID=UPI000B792F61|nr:lysM domain receptor-like kinase 3 [Chenopodium quinoa]